MSAELENAKVGDFVAEYGAWSGVSIMKIDRVTPSQIVTANEKWHRKTGRLVGDTSTWHRRSIRLATPEDHIKARVQLAQRRIDKLKITEQNLEAAEALIKLTAEQGVKP